jgi:hypothetical protein
MFNFVQDHFPKIKSGVQNILLLQQPPATLTLIVCFKDNVDNLTRFNIIHEFMSAIGHHL